MTAPTNGSGGANPCLHEAWETHHGGGARCIDCRQYLPTPPAQVGAATDSGEGVAQAARALLDDIAEHSDKVRYVLSGKKILALSDALAALASPTKPVADSVEAVASIIRDYNPKPCGVEWPRNAAKAILASMPSTDQEGLVGTTSADTILYSIKHHLAVMGDTREGLECALADAKSLVANLEARARQTGSEGA